MRVAARPPCQFYCGMPLITEEGYALGITDEGYAPGTLSVLDFEPRQLAFEEIESLRRLSHQVLTLLELRRRLIKNGQMIKELVRRGYKPPLRRRAPKSRYKRTPRSQREC